MGSPPNPRVDAYLDQVRAGIVDHGWMIQAVAVPNQTGDTDGLIAYTVGMTSRGLPELLVMDTPTPWHAATLLNQAGHIHTAQPGGIRPRSVVLIGETRYAVAEMPLELAEFLRTAHAIYGPQIRVLMLISERNFTDAQETQS